MRVRRCSNRFLRRARRELDLASTSREFCVTNRAVLSYSSRREVDGSSRDGFLLRFGAGTVGNEQQGFLDTLPIR